MEHIIENWRISKFKFRHKEMRGSEIQPPRGRRCELFALAAALSALAAVAAALAGTLAAGTRSAGLLAALVAARLAAAVRTAFVPHDRSSFLPELRAWRYCAT